MNSDDQRYFGIMTLTNENRPGRQGHLVVNSCHVFALESPVHADHAQKVGFSTMTYIGFSGMWREEL